MQKRVGDSDTIALGLENGRNEANRMKGTLDRLLDSQPQRPEDLRSNPLIRTFLTNYIAEAGGLANLNMAHLATEIADEYFLILQELARQTWTMQETADGS